MKKTLHFKRAIVSVLVFILISTMLTGCGTKQNQDAKVAFPQHDINGYIMWGAGGAMDNMARSITPLVEKNLGKSIILQNKTGASGAVATQYVFDQKADGYSILYGAENPQLYGVLNISHLDYSDFEAINIFARGVAIVVAPPEAKWNTVEDLIADAKEPGKLKMSVTGPAGLPYVMYSLMKSVSGIDSTLVPFDGEGPALTAMLGGHVDYTIVGLSAAREMIRAGKVKALAVISNEEIEGMEEIPVIGKIIPDYQKYLPWGPFFGAYVKKDTPEEVKAVLRDAFKKAFEEKQFQDFIKDFGAIPMGISGKEADEFVENWQRVSAWLLYDAGGAETSPEKLGIKRIGE